MVSLEKGLKTYQEQVLSIQWWRILAMHPLFKAKENSNRLLKDHVPIISSKSISKMTKKD